MTDKEQLVNQLIISMIKYNSDQAVEIENDIRIAFKNYDVSKLETQIVPYEGGKNEDFIKHFLISKKVEGCTDRTIEYYGKTLKWVFSRVGKNADEITTDDIRIYLAVRQAQDGISKTTANNELRVLSSFFAHLAEEDVIVKSPCLKLHKIKQDKVKKKAFTEMDIEKIRYSCQTSRETALIEVLLSTGCRISEVCSMEKEKVNEEMTIIGKGRKERKVYMNARAMLAVQHYLSERKDDNPYLFPAGIDIIHSKISRKGITQANWYQNPDFIGEGYQDKSGLGGICRKIGKKAGVDNCHPHRFRRTCATSALKRGMPIEQVSKMLGHDSIATTQIYLDLDDKDLEIAHRKYVV